MINSSDTIRWRIELFGGLRLIRGDQVETRFPTQKVALLLAHLAFYLDRTHAREVLIDLLWPEVNAEAGRVSLRQALRLLRHQLEPPDVPPHSVLLADRFSVRLNPETVSTDVMEFKMALYNAAHVKQPHARTEWLVRAVELYKGDLLPGYYEAWVVEEQARINMLYLGALKQLIGCSQGQRDWQRAIEYAHRALQVDPLQEDIHLELMRLYALMGQPGTARKQYQQMESLWQQEFGTPPPEAASRLLGEIQAGQALTEWEAARGFEGMEELTLSTSLSSQELDNVPAYRARYFLNLARRASWAWHTKEEEVWLDRFEREFEALQDALAWAEAHDPLTMLQMVVPLGRFWLLSGHWTEGRGWITRGLKACKEAPLNLRAQAYLEASKLAYEQGDYEQATALAEQSVALSQEGGDQGGMARALNLLGLVHRVQGDYTQARALHERSLALFREIGDQIWIAAALNNLGTVAMYQGDYKAARAHYGEAITLNRRLGNRAWEANNLTNLGVVLYNQEEYLLSRLCHEAALQIHRELGERNGVASSLNNLGLIEIEEGQANNARILLEEALEINRAMGNRSWEAGNLENLARVATLEGDYERARTLYLESMALYRMLNERSHLPEATEGLAEVASLQGAGEEAARLFGAADAMRLSLGVTLSPSKQARYESYLQSLRDSMGKRFQEAYCAGYEAGWDCEV